MSDPVRFTPEELKALVKAGDLTEADLVLLNPSDAAVAAQMIKQNADPMAGLMTSQEVNPRMGIGGFQPDFDLGHAGAIASAVSAPPVIAAGATGGPLAGLAELGRQSVPYVSGALGGLVGNAFGHPWAGWAIGTALGGGKTLGRAKPKLAAASEPAGISPPANYTASGSATPPMRMSGFSRPDQITTSATPNAARPPRLNTTPTPEPPNVTKSSPGGTSGLSTSGMPERMNRGVTNDFRGRVHFEKDAAPTGPRLNIRSEFPPGAGPKTSPDVFRQLQNELAEAAYGSKDVDRLRKLLQGKLDKPRRRTPK